MGRDCALSPKPKLVTLRDFVSPPLGTIPFFGF
jgi:hypothetical protein